jgi:hypothetical protein
MSPEVHCGFDFQAASSKLNVCQLGILYKTVRAIVMALLCHSKPLECLHLPQAKSVHGEMITDNTEAANMYLAIKKPAARTRFLQ